MLAYRSSGLRIAELWFDEPDRGIDADIVRYSQALSPPAGVESTPFYTLVVDLSRPEGDVLGRMSKETRYEIRRATQKDRVECGASGAPDRELLGRFRSTFEAFARQQGLPFPWDRVERLAAANQLDVSWARFDGVGEVVFHAHVVVGRRTRLLHSVSTPSAREDPALRGLVGRANRLLHWDDMVRFKGDGLETYDFGGWYEGSSDTKRLQINAFKESFGGRVEKDYDAERLLTTRARIAVLVATLVGRRR